MKLIKYKANWADEFDVYGLAVVTDEEWAKTLEVVNDAQYPQELNFGTNEDMEFDSPEKFLEGFTVTDITPDEAIVFSKFFGSTYSTRIHFGWIPEIEGDYS